MPLPIAPLISLVGSLKGRRGEGLALGERVHRVLHPDHTPPSPAGGNLRGSPRGGSEQNVHRLSSCGLHWVLGARAGGH